MLKTSLRHVGSVESLLDNYIPDEMKIPKSKGGKKKGENLSRGETAIETHRPDDNTLTDEVVQEEKTTDGNGQQPQSDDIQSFIDKMIDFTLASSSTASSEEYLEDCPEYGVLDPYP